DDRRRVQGSESERARELRARVLEALLPRNDRGAVVGRLTAMASTVVGVDLGTTCVRVIQGRAKGTSFVPARTAARPGDGAAPIDALVDALRESKLRAPRARLGLTGRDMMLRYSQVPRLADAQRRGLMKFEIEKLATQAGGNLASDFNLLPMPPGLTGDDTVLVALARNEALEAAASAMKGSRAAIGPSTPNSIALYDAFLKLGPVASDGVLLACIGAEHTDVAILLGP